MKELDYTKMGMRIRQVRRAKGWSQDALAKKCGISMSFLGHIERGTRIMSLETFVGICGALGAGADELLWGAVHPPDPLHDMWDSSGRRLQEGRKARAGSRTEEKTGADAEAAGWQEKAVDQDKNNKDKNNKDKNKDKDSYAMYVRIMKSVAEIMNEA